MDELEILKNQLSSNNSKTKERLHLREQWVSTLALKLAIAIEEIQKEDADSPKTEQSYKAIRASFLFWNKDKKFDKYTLDPNYLVKA